MSRQGEHVDNEKVPHEIARALRSGVRLEWATIITQAVTVALIFLVLGNSQAMKTAWIEDMLAFIPPIAFLLGVRVTKRPANTRHPYGYHRSIGIAHVVAGTALLVMGGYLIVDSALKLITVEHPTIGGITVFGHTVWLGWLMMLVLVITGIPPLILGRMKLKVAPPLHNKVLFADADMSKANWMTSLAAVLGVAGIGLGWWWTDSVAALVIAASILKDGITNLAAAVGGLMDARPTTVDNKEVHPILGRSEEYLQGLDWVRGARVRGRDEGQVFQLEGYVIPRATEAISVQRLEAARRGLLDLDWKIRDVVIVPVEQLPEVLESR